MNDGVNIKGYFLTSKAIPLRLDDKFSERHNTRNRVHHEDETCLIPEMHAYLKTLGIFTWRSAFRIEVYSIVQLFFSSTICL